VTQIYVCMSGIWGGDLPSKNLETKNITRLVILDNIATYANIHINISSSTGKKHTVLHSKTTPSHSHA